jgi:hypothetical protein
MKPFSFEFRRYLGSDSEFPSLLNLPARQARVLDIDLRLATRSDEHEPSIGLWRGVFSNLGRDSSVWLSIMTCFFAIELENVQNLAWFEKRIQWDFDFVPLAHAIS